jgi:hypothetical protein
MFRKNILKYISIVFFGILLFLTGCDGANPIVSIQIENHTEEEPIYFVVGEFSFDNLNLVVSYENGETKVVSITEEILNQDDIIKLYKLGKNEIEVIYERHKTTMYVYGTNKEFKNLYLNDVTMTYTGEEIKVEVEGNIPDTAQIIYPQGNTYKNVGTYVTKAIVFENGYEVLELTADVVITKAEYDMSSVEFENAEYTYDRNGKMLNVQGKLPDGVSVSYYVDGLPTNELINSGVYEITAVFTGDSHNYEPIEDKKATLTIKKATHNMEGIRLEETSFVYDGHEHEIKLKNEILLPNGVEAIYKNNKHIDAGTYEVVVEFEIDDLNNYEVIEPLKTIMKIEKAEYDLGDYYLLGQKVKYDSEKTYEAVFDKELPSFIKVEYEYYPQKVKGTWNILSIDATKGYWYKGVDGYINVGKGTVINVAVASKEEVVIEALNDPNNFEVQVENGIATITCINEDGLKSITISDPSNDEISTTIDVTLCDLIFHNEEEPLPSEVLPSLKGEYIVVAKLIVIDNNFYGEKELTAILIIE